MLQACKISAYAFLLTLGILLASCGGDDEYKNKPPIRGWNISSGNVDNALRVIDVASTSYDINHLQFSHQLVHNLKDVRPAGKAELVNRLASYAHGKGIKEVCVWDHALYDIGYYPEELKVTIDGKQRLDLDNPYFWSWLRSDYSGMLALIPEVDGVVLNIMDTDGLAAHQHSTRLISDGEKLAAVVDSLAAVIIDDFQLSLYVRASVRDHNQFDLLMSCMRNLSHPGIRIMTKAVSQDFLLTHPVSSVTDSIKRYPAIVEFDAAHEYSGQSILASMFPELTMKRWKEFMSESNVMGYVARTDRLLDSKIIDGPCEINLYALKRAAEDPWVNPEAIYREFITKKYGEKALPFVEPAFRKAYDIITSMIYTLGIQIANRSVIDFTDQKSYLSLNPGKWQRSMEYTVEHDVNKTFHYWRDVTNHLCPPSFKHPDHLLAEEISFVSRNGWLEDKELMNAEYLADIVAEKNYGVRLAQSALNDVMEARSHITHAEEYTRLIETFRRTEMAARIWRASAKAYFGYRVYSRGGDFRTSAVALTVQEGLDEILAVSDEIMRYPYKGPRADFAFESLATEALAIRKSIMDTGWSSFNIVNAMR